MYDSYHCDSVGFVSIRTSMLFIQIPPAPRTITVADRCTERRHCIKRDHGNTLATWEVEFFTDEDIRSSNCLAGEGVEFAPV